MVNRKGNMFFNLIFLIMAFSALIWGIMVIHGKTNQPALTMGDHAFTVIDLAQKSDKVSYFISVSGKYAAEDALFKYARGDSPRTFCGVYHDQPLWNSGTEECYPVADKRFQEAYLRLFEDSFADFRETYPVYLTHDYSYITAELDGKLSVIGTSHESQRFNAHTSSIANLGSSSPDTKTSNLKYLLKGEPVTLTKQGTESTYVFIGSHDLKDRKDVPLLVEKGKEQSVLDKIRQLLPDISPDKVTLTELDSLPLTEENWEAVKADLGDSLKDGQTLMDEYSIPDYARDISAAPDYIGKGKLNDKQKMHAMIVIEEARKAGIPEGFALALAYTESNLYHEDVVSSSHAYGIMQITPLTACEDNDATATKACPDGPGVPCPGIVLKTATAEENVRCGMNILNLKLRREARESVYENAVKKYCKDETYQSRYLSYVGDKWRMVARTYNGFGCKISAGADPDYVEKIVDRMSAIS
jgi:hypothetical protein